MRFGIGLSDRHLDCFRIYLEELWSWNQRMNLTGLQDRNRMVIELFLDSLLASPFLLAQGSFLDVGSGAGFPGLPLKIHCPQRRIFLLEPNSKKVAFLKHVLRLMELTGIEAVKSRVETLPKETSYDVVTVRAFGEFEKTLEGCGPLVCQGGHLVAYLGSRVEETLKKNERLTAHQNLRVSRMISYRLPEKQSERHTVIFEKG